MRYDTSIVDGSSARAENSNALSGSSSSWEDASPEKNRTASAARIGFVAPLIIHLRFAASARLAVRRDLLPCPASVLRQIDIASERCNGVLLSVRRVLRDIGHRVFRDRRDGYCLPFLSFQFDPRQGRSLPISTEPEVRTVQIELHGGRLSTREQRLELAPAIFRNEQACLRRGGDHVRPARVHGERGDPAGETG